MPNYRSRQPMDLAELLSDGTTATRPVQWLVGVGLAAPLAVYSLACIVNQTALFPRTRPLGIVEIQGANAVAVGAFYLSLAAFIHCHWFWSVHPVYLGYAQIGKALSLAGVIGALGFWFYNVIVLG
jgi:hypothetical protein